MIGGLAAFFQAMVALALKRTVWPQKETQAEEFFRSSELGEWHRLNSHHS